ncbi:hypothetical protein [Yinghuangia sp. YIM S09857]|uniref:hypothetical protein n=1 Tax=Yinghuangia sp. YIM S09857 TaxID=3436929 RepID=UPI003F5334D2
MGHATAASGGRSGSSDDSCGSLDSRAERTARGFAAFVSALVVDTLVGLTCGSRLMLGNLALAGARYDDAELHDRHRHNIVVLAIALALLAAVAAVLFGTRHHATGVAQLVPILVAVVVLVGVIGDGPGRAVPSGKNATAVPAAGCHSDRSPGHQPECAG